MKINFLHHPLDETHKFEDPVVLAMGFFDGVHLGHQEVINTAKKIADDLGVKLAVLTYDHHPALVYKKLSQHDKKYLTLKDEKMRIFKELGVDQVFVVNYSYKFQDQSPQEFVDNYLVRFNAVTVVAGFDHTYGEKSIANMENLASLAKGRFDVVTVNPILENEIKVSSTNIRKALDKGNVTLANKYLGRTFQTTGLIVHGDQRGRILGFPTINIEHDERQWLPGIGEYVVEVKIGDQVYQGMGSIGRNVTFEPNRPVTVEINLFDFNENVYGENVTIRWHKYLRGEIKFDSADELIEQLHQDEIVARNFFIN